MNIRTAVKADAPGIARVHVDSWRTTYKGILSDDFLKNLSYDQRMELWNRNLSDKGNYTFVAESEDGEIIGFASCGKREANHIDNSGDLTSIYLLETYQGKGVGRKLLEQTFHQFDELGYNKVFVAVLEGNKTRYFYEHFGAKLLRTEKIATDGTELNLFIYEWDGLHTLNR